MNKIEIRRLESGRFVCEIVRTHRFLWFKPYKVRKGLSSLLNEYSPGAAPYALYCVTSEARAKETLAVYKDRFGI